MKYRVLILDQIKTELKLSDGELQGMRDRLNKSSSDELERVYDAFDGCYAGEYKGMRRKL